QGLVLPPHAGLVVDPQARVTVRLPADSADPLDLGSRRVAAGPVAFHGVGAHPRPPPPSPTRYTPADIKTVSRRRAVPPQDRPLDPDPQRLDHRGRHRLGRV